MCICILLLFFSALHVVAVFAPVEKGDNMGLAYQRHKGPNDCYRNVLRFLALVRSPQLAIFKGLYCSLAELT